MVHKMIGENTDLSVLFCRHCRKVYEKYNAKVHEKYNRNARTNKVLWD